MKHLRILCLLLILVGVCLDSNTYVVATTCGGYLNSSTGVITSPNYPEIYGSNTICEWVIEDPNKQRMIFKFESFHTQANCEYDWVEIRDGSSASSTEVGKYCGTSLPANVISSGHQIYVKFRSDSSNNYQGFKLSWGSASMDSCTFGEPLRIYGGHFHTSSGVITSPNFPGLYPHSLNRDWIIDIPEHHLMVLNVRQFHTENIDDYLEIRNGTSEATATRIGRIWGTAVPEKITCTGSKVFLRFVTDATVAYDGFVIEWDSNKLNCGGNLTASTAAISSPDYPKSYNAFGHCIWDIRVSAGSIIQFELATIQFEAVEQCIFDFIEIYDGSDYEGTKLGTYCRTMNHPLYIETNTNVARVWSRSDSPSPRKFHIIYRTICHNRLHGSNGVIESPNFPSHYPGNQNCSWTIEAPVGHAVHLTFSQFDLHGTFQNPCDTDYLEITEGRDNKPEREIGKFCNSKVPQRIIVSTRPQIYLKFRSGNSVLGKGFRLEWAVVSLYNTTLPSAQSCLLRTPYVTRRDDYTYMLGYGGHKIHTQAATWNEARLICKEEGGYLAIVNSIAELNAITTLFNRSGIITGSQSPHYISLGFHDLYGEGQYVTIHEQSLSEAGFSIWEDGQPEDNSKDSEDCGALSINGKLNDISCEAKYGFVCEIPVDY